MDALLIVVIVVAVLMGLVGLGVVAGSGRTRRMDERRFHAEQLRREAEEGTERTLRFERRPEGEEAPPEAAPEDSPEHLQGPRDDR
jgi:hypothetical protein